MGKVSVLRMVLSAFVFLLGCASALADGHGYDNKGCCEFKRVTGSSKKSGDYFFVDRRDGLPDYCKDGCVYMKEADGDDNEYCFKPSSTYTAECQDDRVTGEQGAELPEDYSTTNNMGDHGDMGDHSKPTTGGLCDFTAIDNVEEPFNDLWEAIPYIRTYY